MTAILLAETFTDADGTALTTPHTSSVVGAGSVADIQSNSLRLRTTLGSFNGTARNIIDLGSVVSEFDVSGTVLLPATVVECYPNFHMRSGGTWATANWPAGSVAWQMNPTANTVGIQEVNDAGTQTDLVGDTLTCIADHLYGWRFTGLGGALTLVIWDITAGNSETSGQVTLTATTTRHAGTQYAAMRMQSGAAAVTVDIWWDDLIFARYDVPQLVSLAEEQGTSFGANQVITMPAVIGAGDLLLCFAAVDNPSTTTIDRDAGAPSQTWTDLEKNVVGSNIIRSGVFGKIAAGGDTLTLDAATQDYCVKVLVYRNHGITAVAQLVAGASPNLCIETEATSGNADPGSCDLGGVKGVAWLAVAMVDMTTGDTISAVPTGFTLVGTAQKSANSTSSVGLSAAVRYDEADQVEDPGAFTNNTQEWIAYTVGIPARLPSLPRVRGLNQAVNRSATY